ncbi:MAG TPA: carbohydrate binding domain-containing protein, partial [Anaerolineae bacterium]|nr:carbohydrate binding domain-containing protein [Anaerolineae bacterium]
EGATGTPVLSLTAVTAYFIQFSDNGGDTGFSGTFYVDQMRLFDTATTNVYDFEAGMPSGYFSDPGGEISANVVTTATLSQLGVITNHVLAVSVVTPRTWAGLQGFNLASPQDWSTYDGVSFWFKGTNSGKTFLYAITQGGGAGLYQASFADNSTNWKLINLPWQAFTYREGATGTPVLSLTAVTAYFIQFSDNGSDTGFNGTFYLDQMAVYGPTGTFYMDQIANPLTTSGAVWHPSKVAFSQATYLVNEGAGSALIGVSLDTASTVPVTVSYMTQGGTALPDVDYTPVSGTLVFAPAATAMTFTVPITDNVQYAIYKTVGLSLTDVISGELGAINPASLIINDNDAPNVTVVDNFESGLPTGRDIFNNQIGYSTWGSTQGNVAITVTGGISLPGGTLPNNVLQMTSNIENWGGFTDAFKDDQSWGHQDWSRYDGLRFWFYGTHSGQQIQIEIFDNRRLENLGDSAERWYQRFTEDFSGWKQISLPFALFQRRTDYQPGGAPNDGLNLTEVSGYAFNMPSVASTTIYYVDQVELYGDLSAHPVTMRVNFSGYAYGTIEGQPLTAKLALNTAAVAPITVTYVLTEGTAAHNFDFTGPLSGIVVFAAGEVSKTVTVPTVDDHKVEARESITISIDSAAGATIGYVRRALLVIVDNDTPDPKIIDDFENGVPAALKPYGTVTVTTQSVLATDPLAVPGQDPDNNILHVTYNLPSGTVGGFDRKFDAPQDLSQSDGVNFWFNGTGSGQVITVTLLDNGQPNPGPTNWTLAWSDEFSGTLGAAPNPANWKYDIGVGADGNGWGNNEWEYYTDSRDNSALDGNGNLVIKAMTNTNSAYTCTGSTPTPPGGQCYATSARLLSAGKQEFTYGRVEARLKIPRGQGIWPAFWMLGNDINTTAPWPESGEIDIMENIGNTSDQSKVHGTLHGPGYSGGSGIGYTYDVS